MGTPLHMQVINHPSTAAVTALCVGTWLWLFQGGIPPAALGLSYQRFVAERQWWRALTAQVCHFDMLHLILNVSSLWGLAQQAEPVGVPGASLEYLRLSVLLLLVSAAICMAMYHVAVRQLGQEGMRHTLMVGYSCVLFGWMALIAWRSSGSGARFGLLGLTSVPMAAAPFVLLLVTQLLLPNASLLGHLSGVLAGLLLATGCLDWLTPYWTACLLFWVAVGVCYSLALEGRIGMPYLRLPNAGNDTVIEGGLDPARLADMMERGGFWASGPAGAATPVGASGGDGFGAAADPARGGAAAAAAVVAAARQLQSWAGGALSRTQAPGVSGQGGAEGPPGPSSSSAAAGLTGVSAAAATAAASAGLALPWGNPALALGALGQMGAGGTGPSPFGRGSGGSSGHGAGGTGGLRGGAGAGGTGGAGQPRSTTSS